MPLASLTAVVSMGLEERVDQMALRAKLAVMASTAIVDPAAQLALWAVMQSLASRTPRATEEPAACKATVLVAAVEATAVEYMARVVEASIEALPPHL